MCGICGFYNFKSHRPAEAELLQNMLQVMIHRGPDDSGTFRDRDLAMGMRRLSIIDLAGGKQPITSEDGSVVTVFNGEIYNYRSLRNLLQSRGHALRTASDTEVIVHLYEDYGEECLRLLRGMFALAVWNGRRRQLFLARDRLGIKPLFFSQSGGRLIFGSEIKALLAHPAVPSRMNLEALNSFLSLKYVPAPQTMFEGIYALPPASCLTCDENGTRIKRYWDVQFARSPGRQQSEGEYAEQLESLLRECVELHLVSDVPFGAFLSGGVDSSTLVALMSQYLSEPVKTYSVGFSGNGKVLSELPYARSVAEKLRTDHHEILLEPQHLPALARKVVWHLDQPLADYATVAMYMVSELASRDVKMVLSGEGGDELFAGYARYAGERFSPYFKILPRAAKSVLSAAASRLPGLRRQKLAFYALCQSDEATRLVNWFPLFNSTMKQRLLSEDLQVSLRSYDVDQVFAEQLSRTDARDALNRMLYVDTKLWLPDLLLTRGDKLAMAASVEARVPFLDHKLVEFAAALPVQLKIKGWARKYLLKKVSQNWLPWEIVHRKKQGFPIPVSSWLRKEARQFLRDTLSAETIRQRRLFSPSFVEGLIREHEDGHADHGSLLWGLINVELWQQVFLDSATAKREGLPVAAAGASER